ncbi:MAG: AMP-binding protein [Bacteroidetes bacterium]|nr:AMP-binding protein [Bacteroidota bacterium]
MDHQRFDPNLAFASLDVQERYAENKLRELLEYLETNSPFYQRRFQAKGLSAKGFGHIGELQDFPFTTKEELQQYNWDFLCVPRNAVREYMTSSGTMGASVVIALTEQDLQRLAYNEQQSFLCADGQPGDTYQLALTLDRMFMAGMAYYSGIRAMGASVIRTGPGLPQMQWETIQRMGTNSLVAVPSFLLNLMTWAKEHGISLQQSGIKKVICIGENLRNPDFTLRDLAGKIHAEWPIQLYGTYAATELQTAFTECSTGKGGHHQPDLIWVEIVDDSGTVLPDGEAGEVVISTLGIEGMPLLRYKTGDIAALYAEPCSCGRKSKRLGPIIGRKGQRIKYHGTTLYPAAIFDVMANEPIVKEYLLELTLDALGNDDLILRLAVDEAPDSCKSFLEEMFQSRLRVKPKIVFTALQELQQLIAQNSGRKISRFLDSRIK